MMTDASVEDAPPAVGFDGGVKIGGLWKRSQGLSKFTKANFKHRVFILTDHSLSYYSGTVDVSFCVFGIGSLAVAVRIN